MASKASDGLTSNGVPSSHLWLTPETPILDDFGAPSPTLASRDNEITGLESREHPLVTPPMSRTTSSSSTMVQQSSLTAAIPSVSPVETPTSIAAVTRHIPEGRHIRTASWNELERLVVFIAGLCGKPPRAFEEMDDDDFTWLPDDKLPANLRLVRNRDLYERILAFLGYRMHGYNFEYGHQTTAYIPCVAKYAPSHLPHPWAEAKRLAFAGLLENYPAVEDADTIETRTAKTDNLLQGIRDIFLGGKGSRLERIPEWSSLKPVDGPRRAHPVKSQKIVRRRPSPKEKSVTVFESPVTRQAMQASKDSKDHALMKASGFSHEQVSTSKGTKRKAPYGEAEAISSDKAKKTKVEAEVVAIQSVRGAKDEKVTPSSNGKAKKTQHGKDGNGKQRTPFSEGKSVSTSDLFCRNVKEMLNARTGEKTGYPSFADAILPDNRAEVNLPNFALGKTYHSAGALGDPTGLHPREVTLCRDLAMPYDLYRCQKARAFIGLALLVEYNYQKLDENKDWKPWNFGRSQTQLFGNVDVNKLSDMYRAWETWGWVENMAHKVADTKMSKVSDNYLERFPRSDRLRWMEELAQFEEKHRGKSHRVALLPARV